MSAPRRAVVALYFSVSDASAVAAIRAAAAASGPHGPVMIHSLCDVPYDRTSIVLEGPLGEEALSRAAGDVVRAAVASAPSAPAATPSGAQPHPRLGLVDHVSVQPLDGCEDDGPGGEAASRASEIAVAAESAGLSVLLYGWAHPEGVSLAEQRRRAGFFRPAADGIGAAACTVGACPPVLNANVPFDVPREAGAAEAARRWVHAAVGKPLSERHGGLTGVETATLHHGAGGVEVACNLTMVGRGGAGPDEVLRACGERFREAAAGKAGSAPAGVRLAPRGGYTIGVAASEAVRLASEIRAGRAGPLLRTIEGT